MPWLEKVKVRKRMEDKREILVRLLHVLQATRAGRDIVALELEQKKGDEYCVIVFDSGNRERVDITADSGLTILADVIDALYEL